MAFGNKVPEMEKMEQTYATKRQHSTIRKQYVSQYLSRSAVEASLLDARVRLNDAACVAGLYRSC